MVENVSIGNFTSATVYLYLLRKSLKTIYTVSFSIFVGKYSVLSHVTFTFQHLCFNKLNDNLGEARLLEITEVRLGEATQIEVVFLDVGDQLKVAHEDGIGDALPGLDGAEVFALERFHVGAEDAIHTEHGQRRLRQSRLVERLRARLGAVASRCFNRV